MKYLLQYNTQGVELDYPNKGPNIPPPRTKKTAQQISEEELAEIRAEKEKVERLKRKKEEAKKGVKESK